MQLLLPVARDMAITNRLLRHALETLNREISEVLFRTEHMERGCAKRLPILNREDAMDRGRWKKLIKIG